MDKEKVIKKIKQGAPATSAIVVAACIGVSLSGYQAPVYEAQAQTKETKTRAIKCVCVHNPYKSMYNIIDSPWINWS